MNDKLLGKITRIDFGIGGYQDSMMGLTVTLEGEGWGTSDFIGSWDWNLMESDVDYGWSEEDRDTYILESVRFLSDLLRDAKVHSLNKLVNKPVEVMFEKNTLKSWRILTEVI